MAFAVKLQVCTGIEGQDPVLNPDYRGGEPKDTHATVKLPGMKHGVELDPVDDSELDSWLTKARAFNAAVADFPEVFGAHLEMRIMDSDGRV